MRKVVAALALCAAVPLAGCYSPGERALGGAALGGAGGAIIGSAVSGGRTSGTLVGAAIGAASGAMIGAGTAPAAARAGATITTAIPSACAGTTTELTFPKPEELCGRAFAARPNARCRRGQSRRTTPPASRKRA